MSFPTFFAESSSLVKKKMFQMFLVVPLCGSLLSSFFSYFQLIFVYFTALYQSVNSQVFSAFQDKLTGTF